MKILHISPTDIRYDSRILKELKSISKLKNKEIIAYGVNDDEGHKYEISSISYIRTFNLFTKKLKVLPRPLRYVLNLTEAMLRFTISAIKYRPNIIHCHDTLFLPIALLIKIFCNSILIYDAHELESDKAGQTKVLSKFTFFIEKIAWKRIDILISVSPSILNWYNTNLGFKKSELILNSPELKEQKSVVSKNNYLREKFNIPQNKKIFLYLGIISKLGRSIELYIKAFKSENIDSHLVFIGYGDFVEEIKNSANEYSNIHYHQSVAHDQVVEISKSADVGLCMIEPISLSDTYSLPNKLFEYAFSNLYVLSSDLPDIRNIIESFDLGTCCKNNVSDLIYSINSINESPSLKKSKNVNDLYHLSWSYQEEKLLKLYKNL